jgi:hypothetical protein
MKARVINVMIKNEGNFKEIFNFEDSASLKIICVGRNTSYL